MSSTCIIIPCYNEEERFLRHEFEQYLEGNDNALLFVNDGSTDGTSKILHELYSQFERCHILELEKNSGKAGAIRAGVQFLTENHTYEYTGYWDADLATPLSEIALTRRVAEEHQVDFVLCSRINRLGANVQRSPIRHYLGRIFATLASIILKLSVYDTQCGAKLIKSDLAKKIFTEPFQTNWFFDVELLFRLKKMEDNFLKMVYEYPINDWHDVSGSKLKATDFLKAPFLLFKIYRHYR